MIISRTPFRVSFAGGGTDLPAFYREEFGAVLSAAIRRHMYVTLHRRFEPNFRIGYSKTEIASSVSDIEHSLVREALRASEVEQALEITTIADVPAGTGLGSSSTLTVGLLHALAAFRGAAITRAELAAQACSIEIERLGHPIGKQDQYAAAFGGLCYLRFFPDGSVAVEPIALEPSKQRELEQHVLLVYLGKQRDANAILALQRDRTAQRRATLREMRAIAQRLRDMLTAPGQLDVESFGRSLHEGWQLKRSLGLGISNPEVDQRYQRALGAGALGGKLLGAGGSGFLLLFAPPDRHARIGAALGDLRQLPFEIDPWGTRIVFDTAAEPPSPERHA